MSVTMSSPRQEERETLLFSVLTMFLPESGAVRRPTLTWVAVRHSGVATRRTGRPETSSLSRVSTAHSATSTREIDFILSSLAAMMEPRGAGRDTSAVHGMGVSKGLFTPPPPPLPEAAETEAAAGHASDVFLHGIILVK